MTRSVGFTASRWGVLLAPALLALVVKEGEGVIFHEVAPDPERYADALKRIER